MSLSLSLSLPRFSWEGFDTDDDPKAKYDHIDRRRITHAVDENQKTATITATITTTITTPYVNSNNNNNNNRYVNNITHTIHANNTHQQKTTNKDGKATNPSSYCNVSISVVTTAMTTTMTITITMIITVTITNDSNNNDNDNDNNNDNNE